MPFPSADYAQRVQALVVADLVLSIGLAKGVDAAHLRLRSAQVRCARVESQSPLPFCERRGYARSGSDEIPLASARTNLRSDATPRNREDEMLNSSDRRYVCSSRKAGVERQLSDTPYE